MALLTPAQYDSLERAITLRHRIAIVRRGGEIVVVPSRLYVANGRERIEAVHPSTGDVISFSLDEIESLHVVR